MSVCVYVVCVVHLFMVAYFFIKTLTLTFKYSKIVFICVCVYLCGHACHSVHLEVRGQLLGVRFFFPPCGFRGLNSGGQAWLPSAYTCWPISSWPFKWKLFNETPEGSFTVYFLDFIWTGLFQRSPNMFQFSYFSDASFWLNRNKKFFFSRLHVPVEQNYGNSTINQTAALGSLNGQPSGEVHQRVGWLSLRTIRWQRFRENV